MTPALEARRLASLGGVVRRRGSMAVVHAPPRWLIPIGAQTAMKKERGLAFLTRPGPMVFVEL